ncbi:hypothetical protein ACO0RG_001544 [Hanseniaspora osmophila]|uniref:1-(5-phosphoribosyl)-5-[(5-phosphoribosylamino)methylideneamino] imidazole-4-carboxamide isomerase n=1 Tax=Hanseniaspora osmophila TaxID=56408 RepID=A0A1E5R0Z2_9ASCO|nr:1-(5-phosphoribosyl)-5-[(5-phosphoribosylamino)methylideneamino] imidazole-4-carboxamide isomerase [Hanseniaspora osmophila]
MTRFVGCIDIHGGQVKQIVGSTLANDGDEKAVSSSSNTEPQKTADLATNFVSTQPSSYYADLYINNNIESTHIIMLDGRKCPDTIKCAQEALSRKPNFFQVGGGMNDENCLQWLNEYKAAKVILTSYLFDSKTYEFQWDKVEQISKMCTPQRLVIDLSCKRSSNSGSPEWTVCMNKWQTLTNLSLNKEIFEKLNEYCDEFLIHAADVEGLCQGIDEELVAKLGEWCKDLKSDCKVIYAGGAKSLQDLQKVKILSGGKVDLTFGSSLDIFGGKLVKFDDCCQWNLENCKY